MSPTVSMKEVCAKLSTREGLQDYTRNSFGRTRNVVAARQGFEPDVIVYSSVIHACTKHGDIARAASWVQTMRTRGVQPNE
eukprot:2401666-Amphidinium_carterae.1